MHRVFVVLSLCLLSWLSPVSADSTVRLNAGLNVISITVEPNPALSSHQVGAVIGSNLRSFARLSTGGTAFETTYFDSNGAQGPDFDLVPGEGYLVDLAADTEFVLEGVVAAAVEVDLEIGQNLVGLHPVGPVFRAYDLLRRLGDSNSVASVSRFNVEQGRFESAAQTPIGPAGKNFSVRAGDGLLISMLQPLSGFSAPVGGPGMASEHFAIPRSVLSSGGGLSDNAGDLTLQSVIGQSSALGMSENAQYRLLGGFLAQ